MEHLDRYSPIPLYYQLKQKLLESFESGEFPLGKPIPAEMDLTKTLNISRATVRRAMQELEHEGYINRLPGKGTFVLHTHINRGLTRLTSFTEDMQARNQKVSSQLLDFGHKEPAPHIAELFQIHREDLILYIYRLRLADDLPIAINISYVKLPENVSISESELMETVSLWELLDRKGIRPIESDRVIEAFSAKEEYAHLLKVPLGAALLQVNGMAYTVGHLPVEYSQVISSGERYKYALHLER